MPAITATAPGVRALEPIATRPPAAVAPLSADTVAHAARERSEPPAIHISIDRIEVRAAPQPPKPAPSRPRPAPQVPSLHDYLRGKPSR